MPAKSINIVGQRFKHLTVLELDYNDKGKIYWKCKCDCGKIISVLSGQLRNDGKTSCGCHRITGDRNTPEYGIWKSFRRACTDPKHKSYNIYGAKGITVCQRWETFKNFIADMGRRPEGMVLARIDKNKGFCKKNCEWRQNSKRACLFTHNGQTLSISEWARRLNINWNTLYKELTELGWSLEEVIENIKRKGISSL
jgi:hypothetical protein